METATGRHHDALDGEALAAAAAWPSPPEAWMGSDLERGRRERSKTAQGKMAPVAAKRSTRQSGVDGGVVKSVAGGERRIRTAERAARVRCEESAGDARSEIL